MSFTKKSAQYCPRNYYAAIGLAGTWYEIEGTYHTVKQYWWGNIHQNDSTEFYSTYKPLGLTRGYIYLDAATGEYCTKQFTFN